MKNHNFILQQNCDSSKYLVVFVCSKCGSKKVMLRGKEIYTYETTGGTMLAESPFCYVPKQD